MDEESHLMTAKVRSITGPSNTRIHQIISKELCISEKCAEWEPCRPYIKLCLWSWGQGILPAK